jgi:hypothetical protein
MWNNKRINERLEWTARHALLDDSWREASGHAEGTETRDLFSPLRSAKGCKGKFLPAGLERLPWLRFTAQR